MRGRRARALASLTVVACLVTGCGKADDKADRSSADSSSGSSTSKGSSDGATKSPSGGSSATANGDGTDPNVDDHGAPGSVDAQGRQSILFKRIPGNTTGACLTVGNRRDVKSGGFVGGSFADARKSYGKATPGLKPKQVRLYWIPVHTKPMGGVTVTATSGGDTVKITEREVADAEQWKFYYTVIGLPHKGTWKFNATSGSDKGCFVATF